MEKICLNKLTEIRTLLKNKLSELELPIEETLSFTKEVGIAEGITNRCKEKELLAIRQKIENLLPDNTNLGFSIQEIINDINDLLT
jgi:hypothetical protein